MTTDCSRPHFMGSTRKFAHAQSSTNIIFNEYMVMTQKGSVLTSYMYNMACLVWLATVSVLE